MLERMFLSDWFVNHYDYKQGLGFLDEPGFVPEGFLRSMGPELVHGLLRRYGFLREPYFGKDLQSEKWVEERDWVYFTEFTAKAPQGKVYLCFEGLDTVCDVFLNGEKLGFCRNMHIPHRFDVTGRLLMDRRNRLYVRFYSPSKYFEDFDLSQCFSSNSLDRMPARKAQMNYSWDFCGRSISSGIWKDAYLSYIDDVTVKDFYLHTQEISGETASLELSVEIDACAGDMSGVALRCQVRDDSGDMVYSSESPCIEANTLPVVIEKPSLWWPRPYGPQPLYRLTIELLRDGRVLDNQEHRFGIRTIELLQEPMEDGISFAFRVNGKTLFMRGANWVPAHTVYTSIKDDDYDTLLQYAVEGNLSMLRVWGGGIYESDRFFELCDQLGIVVFQDFMLACGIYPQTEDFFSQMREEAEIIIKKYRNYTCLAVWSGDNENDQSYTWAGKMEDFVQDKLNKVVLPEIAQKFDPHRPYVESSPCSPHRTAPGGNDPNSDLQGDMHLYLVGLDPESPRYYKNIKNYKPRFISEFGFLSLPEKESYYQFNFLREMPELAKGDEVIQHNLAQRHKSAETDDSLIYFYQIYNSLALKYWIEYLRSIKGVCAGSLYWKFNDPPADTGERNFFPTLMSVIDFYKRPKMTFYFTKRAYEDTIVFLTETETGLAAGYANEKPEAFHGSVSVCIKTVEGAVVWLDERPAVIGGDSCGTFFDVDKSRYQALDPKRHYLSVCFSADSGERLENFYYLLDIREVLEMELPPADVGVKVLRLEEQKALIAVSSDALVPCLRLGMLRDDVRFTDNYFPLEAGAEKTVEITCAKGSIADSPLFSEGINAKRKVFEL